MYVLVEKALLGSRAKIVSEAEAQTALRSGGYVLSASRVLVARARSSENEPAEVERHAEKPSAQSAPAEDATADPSPAQIDTASEPKPELEPESEPEQEGDPVHTEPGHYKNKVVEPEKPAKTPTRSRRRKSSPGKTQE